MIGAVTLKPGRLRLTRPEKHLWDAYPAGATVELGPDLPTGEGNRTIRAEVVAALLLGGHDRQPGLVPAVKLRGARITGRLNISGGEVGCELLLDKCVLEEAPDFSNARARQIRMSSCRLPGLDGAGLRTDGYLSLSDCTIAGEVRLVGGLLSGELRMNRTVIENPGGHSLFAGGLVVEGGTFVRSATLVGTVRLIGAQMRGGMFLEGTTLRDPSKNALALVADNITVESKLECSRGFTADGTIRLRGARINGTLSFDEGRLRSPGGRALHLGYSQVNELILTPSEPIEGRSSWATPGSTSSWTTDRRGRTTCA